MPTNPLWLEHTEKAAWDTVQSLRQELERERARIEHLAQLQPAWPKLVNLLDEAKREHGIASDDYEQIAAELCARLRALKQDYDTLRAELDAWTRERERERALGPTESERAREATPRAFSPAVRWFASLLERRRAPAATELRRPDAARRQRLIEALELKVEELAQARAHELLDLAVEIGSLALKLARSAKRERPASREPA
jgi:hypothetical protein